MNISPIVNSVKCTVFACFAQFWHVLEVEGSTAVVSGSSYKARATSPWQQAGPAASYNTPNYYNLIVL